MDEISDAGVAHAVTAPKGVTGVLYRVCFYIGAAALLVAMSSDAIAVLGRHLGLPLLGSIEIVQACIVIAASASMVGATVAGNHASVHIIVERVPAPVRRALDLIANLFGAIAVAGILTGSVWVASDLFHGHERTELLHLPLTPLRLFWCSSAGLMVVLFLARAMSALRPEASDVA